MNHPEISGYLISEEEIKQRLASIFVDSIVLQSDYRIKVVSKNLEDLLEYTSAELHDKSIDFISTHNDFRKVIERELRRGFFEDVSLELTTRSNLNLRVSISGFYLGLISDINGYIIIKIKISEDPAFLQRELYKKTRELDAFIYRTAHDLRGPLATVKGLINLIKIRKDDTEINELVKLIEIHADKLDERLFKLLYLADTDETPHPPRGCVDFSHLKDALRSTLANNCELDSISLRITAPKNEVWGLNEFLVTAFANNLLLYVLSLPITNKNEILIGFAVKDNHLKIKMKASGFTVNPQVRKAIERPSFMYNDMLSYPLLVNYYAAQKVAMHLHCLLKIEFSSDQDQFISASIPIQRESQLPLL